MFSHILCSVYLKDNVHFIEQGNAKLTLLILAAINGNITSPARGKSIITSYKNAILFLFKDSDFSPLSFQHSNHCSISINVGNATPNIIKHVHTEKFNVHRRPGTTNVSNTAACVCKVQKQLLRGVL